MRTTNSAITGRTLVKKTKTHVSLFSILDEIVVISLALVSAGLLLLEFTTTLTSAQTALLDAIDISIAGVFLAEFFIRFLLTPHKKKYVTERWWELLACIPLTTPLTQFLRVLRTLRLIRLIHLVRLQPEKSDRYA